MANSIKTADEYVRLIASIQVGMLLKPRNGGMAYIVTEIVPASSAPHLKSVYANLYKVRDDAGLVWTITAETILAGYSLWEIQDPHKRAMNTIYRLMEGMPYQQLISDIESHAIENTLRANNFNQTKTAKVLGMSRGTLHQRLVNIRKK